jgi:hypothetical protein
VILVGAQARGVPAVFRNNADPDRIGHALFEMVHYSG